MTILVVISLTWWLNHSSKLKVSIQWNGRWMKTKHQRSSISVWLNTSFITFALRVLELRRLVKHPEQRQNFNAQFAMWISVNCCRHKQFRVCNYDLWLLSSNWDWDLGPGPWDLGPGNRIENRETRIENREMRNENWELRIENRESKLRLVPVLTVKCPGPPPPPPTTFNHEGALWQQSAFSKNVSGWSPKPIQHKKITRWTARITTRGSPTWSRRSLSKTHNF